MPQVDTDMSQEKDGQIDRFKELARELGCDEDEAAFDAAVKKLSKSKPLPRHEPKRRMLKG